MDLPIRVSFTRKTTSLSFASGKDRKESESPLHTNFKLSADGEFLALVNPESEIVSNAFSPSYPKQFRDVSFGFGLEQSTEVLVSPSASGRMNVPTNGDFGLSWTAEGFDDGQWQSVSNGLGFDTGETDPSENSYPERVLATEPVLYWRLDESTGTIASNLGTLADSAHGQYQGNPTWEETAQGLLHSLDLTTTTALRVLMESTILSMALQDY
jgi:hypothetical protein